MLKRTLCLGLLVAPALTLAHHSRLFLLTTTLDMGHPGEFLALGDLGWVRNGRRYDFAASPGFYMALGNEGRAGVELHSHFAEEDGSGIRYRASGLEGRYRLTGSRDWNQAASLEYEAGARNGEPGGWTGRYIVGKEGVMATYVANLIATKENHNGSRIDWSYSLAAGGLISDWTSAGIELAGGFRREDAAELLPQVGFQLPDGSLIKAGIGIGLNGNCPRTTIRIGYVGHLQ